MAISLGLYPIFRQTHIWVCLKMGYSAKKNDADFYGTNKLWRIKFWGNLFSDWQPSPTQLEHHWTTNIWGALGSFLVEMEHVRIGWSNPAKSCSVMLVDLHPSTNFYTEKSCRLKKSSNSQYQPNHISCLSGHLSGYFLCQTIVCAILKYSRYIPSRCSKYSHWCFGDNRHFLASKTGLKTFS